MDLGEIREIMSEKGVASSDYSDEITIRRDSIVAKLYHHHVNDNNGDVNNHDVVNVDDEQRRILCIKDQIEDPNQDDDALVDLLQTLDDMDITFKALKETDIGRHVNRLRKYPSGDVNRLVKQLVRKWKDLVDDWVKSSMPGEVQSNNLLVDGDSPQQSVPKNQQDVRHNQVLDFAYSPNRQYGSCSYNSESDSRPKAATGVAPTPRRNAQVKPAKSPTSAPLPNRQNEVAIDPTDWLQLGDVFRRTTKKLEMPKSEEQSK